MQQIFKVWLALDLRRRSIVIGATVAVFAAVLALTRMAAAPNMALLYAGLENGAAGDVVTALEQRSISYEVRGGSIFVQSAQRDQLRMILASEGLPANSSQGYELLDGLSGFGTTSQMFDAAYWRAKEGELARTIISSPHVASARVHIANTGSNPFQRDVRPTASVALTTSAGSVTPAHARALRYLVSSAVPGLSPEDVSVIDNAGNLIGAVDEAPVNVADDRAETMRQRVKRLLEARVGHGNAVVEVSVETFNEAERILERRIDPDSRVVISSDTQESSDNSTDQGGGDVTVASNLPDGDAANSENSSRQASEIRERVNYEVSETEREVTRAPGVTKRLTVAVLVNGIAGVDDNGAEVVAPRSEEELAALRDLVASAVGFDEARGDVITIKTMEFEPIAAAGTSAEPSLLASLSLDAMSLIQASMLAVVALILGLFVVRPIMSRDAPNNVPQRLEQRALSGSTVSAAGVEDELPTLTGEIDDSDLNADDIPLVSDLVGKPSSTPADLPPRSIPDEDPVQRLRNLIGERQQESVEILRSWLENEGENA